MPPRPTRTARSSRASPPSRLRDVEDKAAIARTAAARVSPGAAIGLSAGTTTYQLAAELEPIANLTVVTNSIRVAEVLIAYGPTAPSS